MLADTHAHLYHPQFKQDIEEVFQRARQAGVILIINAGFDIKSSYKAAELAERFSNTYATAGVHPHDAVKAEDDYIEQLEKAVKSSDKMIALGEIGLDFYRDLSPRDTQRQVFREQLRLARKLKMPVVIHDRDAHEEMLDIMKEEQAADVGGVIHCFSGDWKIAQECLDMNFYISLSGTITYGRTNKLAEVAGRVPLNRLMVETDAPFLTPEPYRGKRNEPAYVVEVAKKVAWLRGTTEKSIGRACLENACRLFNIQIKN